MRVFLSSTCYDLIDVRAELLSFLREKGLSVSASDQPDSDFEVSGVDNSIRVCEQSLLNSDVVVCVIDRRYGSPLSQEDYDGRSATHQEIHIAQQENKPIFFFIRDRALNDWDQLRQDPDAKVRWVDKSHRQEWVKFVTFVKALPEGEERSNWIDLFSTVADLKTTLESRLLAQLDEYRRTVAFRQDRFVGVHFVRAGDKGSVAEEIRGHFRNSTENVALFLRQGIRVQDQERDVVERSMLAGKDNFAYPGQKERTFSFPVAETGYRAIFCEYQNVHGDGYRVEVPVWTTGANVPAGLNVAPARDPMTLHTGAEKFFLLQGQGDNRRWAEIPRLRLDDGVTLPPIAPTT